MPPSIPIDWNQIHTVFLDMDGTLLDLHFDNYFWLQHLPKRYAEQNNIPFDQAQDRLIQHSQSMEGTLNWYCLDHWSKTLDIDIVTLKHEVSNKIAIRKNVLPFLMFLRSLNKRIILLTNAHINSVNIKFNCVEIKHHFDELIISHDIGLAKEEPGFWEALSEYTSYNKNHCLFIDDNINVLNNANIFGVKHLLSINKPDSHRDEIDTKNYLGINDFQQLMN